MHKTYLLKAIQASIEAGAAILEVYRSEFEVERKEDNSPLTLADRRSHGIISYNLWGFEIPILSEEGLETSFDERKGWETLWVVDPLDGTKEFVKRNGEFTVNIALVRKRRPILGVIYIPVTRRLYYALDGMGAFRFDLNGRETIDGLSLEKLLELSKKLPIEGAQPLRKPYRIVGSRSHPGPELQAFIEQKKLEHKEVESVPAGSSLKLCLVAEGSADIYPRLGPTMEWDTAAGQAIVENAGRKVLSWDTEKPLVYNKETLLNPWFVVK